MKNYILIGIIIVAIAAAVIFGGKDNNMKAFLMMIRKAEGTSGPNGYRTIFGGQLFNSYAQHPNVKVPFGNTYSTAAGAYQFLYSTWTNLANRLGLTNFSPANQDRAAIQTFKDKGAYDDIIAGRFNSAIDKVKKVWASLPGAGYGQREKSLATVRKYYTDAGGTYA